MDNDTKQSSSLRSLNDIKNSLGTTTKTKPDTFSRQRSNSVTNSGSLFEVPNDLQSKLEECKKKVTETKEIWNEKASKAMETERALIKLKMEAFDLFQELYSAENKLNETLQTAKDLQIEYLTSRLSSN